MESDGVTPMQITSQMTPWVALKHELGIWNHKCRPILLVFKERITEYQFLFYRNGQNTR